MNPPANRVRREEQWFALSLIDAGETLALGEGELEDLLEAALVTVELTRAGQEAFDAGPERGRTRRRDAV